MIKIFSDCSKSHIKYDFWNSRNTSVKARDKTTCQLGCYHNEECNYWSFEKGKDSEINCHLYKAHSSAKFVTNANFVSGPKKCFRKKDAVAEYKMQNSCKSQGLDWCPISLGKFTF